jgi:tetratricopeptide (TPR) repeat protein
MGVEFLREQIGAYGSALDRVAAGPASPDAVLEVFLIRDQIARPLAERAVGPEDLESLFGLDRRLKNLAPVLVKTAGSRLVEWRNSLVAAEGAWWWRLDGAVAEEEEKAGASWSLVAAILFPLSLTLVIETSSRFLRGGPDVVGIFSFLVQAFLALLSGAAISEESRRWALGWLGKAGIGLGRPKSRASLAVALFFLVLACWLSLPWIAILYNNRGDASRRQGRIAQARARFERAIKLDPGYAQAHYNLASLYEDLGLFEPAIAEYQTAVLGDVRFLGAYNNLAELLIGQEKYGEALQLLTRALEIAGEMSPEEMAQVQQIEIVRKAGWRAGQDEQRSQGPPVQYFLLRNRAWVYLDLEHWRLALSDLDRALKLNKRGAAAYCLRARALTALGEKSAAYQGWLQCIANEHSETVDPLLLAQARQMLLEPPSPGNGPAPKPEGEKK